MATTAGGEKLCPPSALRTQLIHPVREMLQPGIILGGFPHLKRTEKKNDTRAGPLRWAQMLRVIQDDLLSYVMKTRNVSLL